MREGRPCGGGTATRWRPGGGGWAGAAAAGDAAPAVFADEGEGSTRRRVSMGQERCGGVAVRVLQPGSQRQHFSQLL